MKPSLPTLQRSLWDRRQTSQGSETVPCVPDVMFLVWICTGALGGPPLVT